MWCGCVVAVVDGLGWWPGEFEWIPVTTRTTISTVTAPIAASGPPMRRGRWLMECMTRSSEPVMNDAAAAASAPASSKVTGSAGFGTGGGGAGGTTTVPGSVRRTVDEPETRKALAGKGASPLPSSRRPAGVWARISSSVCSWRW